MSVIRLFFHASCNEAFICPYFRWMIKWYCSSVWHFCRTSVRDKLELLNKRALGAVSDDIRPLLRRANWSRWLMSGGELSLLASVSSRKVCARNNKFSGPSDVFSDPRKILLAIGGEHFLFTMKVPSWRTLLFLLIVVVNVSFCQSDTSVAATHATKNSSEWVVFSYNLRKLPVPNCVYTGQLFLSSI